MVKIWLVRHSEAVHNASAETPRNASLTNKGRCKSGEISGRADLVICSTLRRARQTLDHSKLVYSTLVFTELCREVRDGNPVNLYNGEQNVHETEEDIKKRVAMFKQILHDYSKKYSTIVVISHGIFLHYLSGHSFYNSEVYAWEME